MTQDRPLLGVLLMLGFCVLAPFADSMAKLLGQRLPLLDLIVLRFGAQAVLTLPIMAVTGRSFRAAFRHRRLVLARTGLHVLGVWLMFLSLRYLPVADAIAIAFVMPFMMLALGRFFLGEEVGKHRLAACAVGFAGTLLVVQPNFVEVGAPALLPLGVAASFSLFMLTTRKLAREVDAIALQCISGCVATPLLLPLVLLDGTAWSAGPAPWGLILTLCVAATLAHLLMTWSLGFAPAATLAPMQYLEIPFATIFGLLIFGDLPNGLAAIGITVTIAAGLYIVAREHAISRASRRQAPGPAGISGG